VAFLLGGINFVDHRHELARGPRHDGVTDVPIVVWIIVARQPACSWPRSARSSPRAATLLFDQQPRHGHSTTRPRGGRPRSAGSTRFLVLRATPRSTSCSCPTLGIAAEVITAFAREKPVRVQGGPLHRRPPPASSAFFVSAHHQFVAGIDPRMANVFTVTTARSSRSRSPR
jgi:cytochrome c oxidase subunit 1